MKAQRSTGPDVIGRRLESGETVLREIGRGALARVYLVSNGRDVAALKLLPPGHGRRCDHEHAIAHAFDHPHLLRSVARVEVAGWPGVRLPVVVGSRLQARGRSPAERLAYLAAFAQLLEALAHLHDLGVVHRDVKPDNVLVDRGGHATLIDFDLAQRVDAPGEAPRVAGTLAYLRPEQARGEAATPASDLYAAGVMLHAALTGEVPFQGAVARLVGEADAAAFGQAPRPSWVDPALVAADPFVAGLLAPDPADRIADARAALASLERLRAAWCVDAAGSW